MTDRATPGPDRGDAEESSGAPRGGRTPLVVPLWAGWALVSAALAARISWDGGSAGSALVVAAIGAGAVALATRGSPIANLASVASIPLVAVVSDRPTAALAAGLVVLLVVALGAARWAVRIGASPGVAAVALATALMATAFSPAAAVAILVLVAGGTLAVLLGPAAGETLAAARLDTTWSGLLSRLERRFAGRARTFGVGRRDWDLEPEPWTMRDLALPSGAWLATAIVASWIQTAAVRTAEYGVSLSTLAPSLSPTSGKGGWDTLYYINIAVHGYELPAGQDFTSRPAEDLVAYFPGYPLLIRFVAQIPGVDEVLASILISASAGLAATMLFWLWMRDRALEAGERTTALAVFLTFPYAFMLTGVAYAEPMTLALVLGAFVLVERHRYVLAGLAGAAATFTRPTALPILLAMPVLCLEQPWTDGEDDGRGHGGRRIALPPTRVLARRSGVLLAGLGVGLFSLWLVSRDRGPFDFWAVQSNYGQGSAFDPGTWLKLEFLRAVPEMAIDAEFANRIAAAVCTVLVAASVPAVSRRFGLGYGVFLVGLVATVLVGAKYFSPGGRYLSLGFPAMALLGMLLARRHRLRVLVVGLFLVGWAVLVWRFARTESLGW